MGDEKGRESQIKLKHINHVFPLECSRGCCGLGGPASCGSGMALVYFVIFPLIAGFQYTLHFEYSQNILDIEGEFKHHT